MTAGGERLSDAVRKTVVGSQYRKRDKAAGREDLRVK